jgi:hypothetical protein
VGMHGSVHDVDVNCSSFSQQRLSVAVVGDKRVSKPRQTGGLYIQISDLERKIQKQTRGTRLSCLSSLTSPVEN